MRRLAVTVATVACAIAVAGCGNLLAAGNGLTCVVLPGGAPNCFGANADGQAGHSAGTTPAAPGAVALPRGWGTVDVAVGMGDPDGDAAVCAATAKSGAPSNVVRCWGDDDHGQLGRGTAGAPSAVPVRIALDDSASTVGVGAYSACAIADGVICWGDDTHGQLGNGTRGIAPPTLVRGTAAYRSSDGTSEAPSLLAVGDLHVCAGIASSITCWGQGTSGQLGNGASADSDRPVAVEFPAKGSTVGAIDAGADFTCAIFTAKGGARTDVRCWGGNAAGQLGIGSTTASAVPAAVSLPDGVTPARVSAGRAHACLLADDGAVWCWGANAAGQVGDGTTVDATAPKRVPGVSATLVAAGADHTCASTKRGRLVCWGGNATGQLGTAAGAPSTTPVATPTIQGLRSPVARRVRVTGGARVGGTVTASTPAWPHAADYDHQWERRTADGWEAIAGADGKRLRIGAALAGHRIRVVVTGRNAWTESAIVPIATATSRAVVVAG